jgi:hypothetical protein
MEEVKLREAKARFFVLVPIYPLPRKISEVQVGEKGYVQLK